MGTFTWDFLLPAEMPDGTYKVLVHDQAGHRQAVAFQIARPEEETLHLVLDLPKSVYYRGETIEGTLRAVLPQDRSLAGVKVSYRLRNVTTAAATTAMTDARGEVHFSIPTDELESYGDARFEAAVPSRSLSVQRGITIATRGFSIGLKTTRQVFLADETFDIRVTTTDAAHRPSAEKLTLKVFRQDQVGETTREELVAEHPLATAADGTARQTLKLTKGGTYLVRATGADRFGDTISRELNLSVSGDDDPQRLLLLVDRRQLKAGDRAEAQIVWRGQPALAVVTCHSDRLIEQRQIALATGTNRLQIPVTAAMAPGFTLTVSVMADRLPVGNALRGVPAVADTGHAHVGQRVPNETHSPSSRNATEGVPYSRETRLHEAACAFHVDPSLQVKIECHRHGDAVAAPRPGEPVDVTVTTCDAQGKPVTAEVSLAMLPADRGEVGELVSGSLTTFFRNHGRATQFQATSSIQFHYQPANRVIGTAEPEEDVPVVPAHIASQQGIPVAKPQAADDNPFGDTPAAPAAAVPSASSADNPFGDESARRRL